MGRIGPSALRMLGRRTVSGAAAPMIRETRAAMVIVGAHYLPFIFLYGMPHFGVLAVALIAGGALLGWYGPGTFSLGGWISAALFVVFAFAGRAAVLREAAHGNAGQE